jgi:hypothetical protein
LFLKELKLKRGLVVILFAFLGWLLCFATIGIGMALTSIQTALVIHAIAAPIIFTSLSLVYFKKYNYTSPFVTAIIFIGFVVFMDFFVVALAINHSFEMFTSFIGTWLPFVLIFLSTFITGVFVNRKKVT